MTHPICKLWMSRHPPRPDEGTPTTPREGEPTNFARLAGWVGRTTFGRAALERARRMLRAGPPYEPKAYRRAQAFVHRALAAVRLAAQAPGALAWVYEGTGVQPGTTQWDECRVIKVTPILCPDGKIVHEFRTYNATTGDRGTVTVRAQRQKPDAWRPTLVPCRTRHRILQRR